MTGPRATAARAWRSIAPDLPLDTWTAWPLPAALGFALGIALDAQGAAPGLVVPLALAVAGAAIRAERRARRPIRIGSGDGRWIAVRATKARRRARVRAVALVAVATAVGGVRHAAWEARPDPLADHGPTVASVAREGRADSSAPAPSPRIWHGRSDGRILALDDPKGARVAVTPRGAIPAGRVTLEGVLVEPERARTPGGYDDLAYLRNRGFDGRLRVLGVISHEEAGGARSWILRRAVDALERRLDPDAAALVAAMTLGVRDDLGDTRDVFAAAGLAHVLALSGLHVGVLVAALAWALRPWPRARAPLLSFALLGFVALVGPTPSVVRAASMAVAGFVMVVTGRGRRDIPGALGLAALGALCAQPRWLFDLGFQLSYLAVAGILALAEPIARILLRAGTLGRVRRLAPRDPRAWLALSVGASVAAQLYALPIVLRNFGSVPLLSPWVNVVGVPLASLLVPVGFATAVAGVLVPPGAGGFVHAPLAWASGALARLLLGVADLASAGPQLAWGELRGLALVPYAAAMVALTAGLRRAWRPSSTLLVVAAALSYGAAAPTAAPEIVVLDVGQGDAILLRLPRGREVLIDGGGTPFSDYDVGARTVVPALRSLGVDALEAVVATHADTDHIEGLRSVLEAIPVGELWVGHPAPDRPLYRALVETAVARGVPIREVRRGASAHLGRASIDVLHPGSDRVDGNDGSVALLVRWNERPVALTLGDLSGAVEADLPVPPTPVLVVAHHGSAHSTSPQLLAAVRPRTAVISVGTNRYGHPAPDVIARLRAAGATVRSTREDGTVRVALDALGGAPQAGAGEARSVPPGPGRNHPIDAPGRVPAAARRRAAASPARRTAALRLAPDGWYALP